MEFYKNGVLRLKLNSKSEYPLLSILFAVALICAAPFTTNLLCYAAFVVCLYRVIRYNAKVFAADYCVLVPFVNIFRESGGDSLLIYLCLIAAAWYFIKGGIKANGCVVVIFMMAAYLITRMQFNISDFVLCFGQLFVIYVLLSKQDVASAERTAKAFCTSVVFSSLYAIVFRNTSQLAALRGEESAAIWGTSFMRFQGLFGDPNYFMTLIIVGLAILAKLKDSGRIKNGVFYFEAAAMMIFGLMTYSKTFFLVFIMLGIIYIIWQFWNRNYVRGSLLIGLVIAAVIAIFAFNVDLVLVTLTRLLAADNISDFTTGRTDIYVQYMGEIMDDPYSFFFGKGFAAKGFEKDPHNIYIEIAYHTGMIGVSLFTAFAVSLVRMVKRSAHYVYKQNFIAKYIVLVMVLALYCTLHGMFEIVTYTEFFLALLAIMLIRKKDEIQDMQTQ
ncbi:MAG: hypothetical protein IJO01_07010 [Oscillospiraceae bacterium]|nr:hypothetical protein [Oscillospiraceae bacterium]